MIPKPKFKAMVKYAKFIIDQYAEHPGPFGVNATNVFAFGRVKVGSEYQNVSDQDANEAWPYIVRELGLVRDQYGEWTLPGREITQESLQETMNQFLKR